MIKSKYLFLVLLLLLNISGYSQQNDIAFLVKTIKGCYAGYLDKTTDETFDKYIRQTIHTNGTDTFHILADICNYFRDPHLSVTQPRQEAFIDSAHYSDNLQKVMSYLSDKRSRKDIYEGYWVNDYNNCVVALKKVSKNRSVYNAYVVECENHTLPEGMVSIQMKKLSDGIYSTEYYSPFTARHAYIKSKFRNDSIFTTGYTSKWRKLKNYTNPILPSLPRYNEHVTAALLDNKTFLITIPGNSEENTKAVDSIVKANLQALNNIQTLIVDIRCNLGGTVRTYAPLLPYVYSQPIVRIGGYRLCSQTLFEEEEKDLIDFKTQNSLDTARIAQKEKYVSEIKNNIGKIILDEGSTYTLDSVKINPKNVAIIANYACLSAAEMMILDFKQSNKVMLFGETTYGGLDYLDNFGIELPSKKYTLNIASVKRQIKRHQPLFDNIGIKPDVFISDNNKDWVKFVQKYYSEVK
ncbi:MAG: S41 family peptidase [Taibaiella sp.]